MAIFLGNNIMIPKRYIEADGEQQRQQPAEQPEDQEQQSQDTQDVETVETDAATEILNKMPAEAKQFAQAVNKKMEDMFKNAPDGFKEHADEVTETIKSLSEQGDLSSMVVELDLFKEYMQKISDQFTAYEEGALEGTLKEEPFASMDQKPIADNAQNIIDYLAESRKEYNGIKEMNASTIDVLESINNFDFAKAGVRKPDLTNVVNELTNTILDSKDNVQETEKMLQGLVDKSDIEADNVEELKKEVEADKKEDDKNKNVEVKKDINLGNEVNEPVALAETVKKFEEKLSDFDKNVLSHYYENKSYGSYVNGDLVTSGCTNKMTSEGIVILCGMALNKAFPEREDVGDDDIDLRMETINYSGGGSNAVIRYSIPEESKGHEFDKENQRYGGDVDSQWLEARISPDVKMKDGKGRAELVIRTFDPKDQSKLVTNRGKRTSVVEFIKNVVGQGDGGSKKSRW